MTSILALDQGTTGSTALVIHQDGTVLASGELQRVVVDRDRFLSRLTSPGVTH